MRFNSQEFPMLRPRSVISMAAALSLLLAVSDAGAQNDVREAFRAECAARAAAAEQSGAMYVAGREGWLFLGRELRHVAAGPFWGVDAIAVSRAKKPQNADPLPAILDFKSQLERAGIELLLVPVPPKVVVYPEKLAERFLDGAGDPQRLDTQHAEFYELLVAKGVRVLDLAPVFAAHRDDAELAPLYCRQDTHWSGGGCLLAAREIARLVGNPSWLADAKRVDLASRVEEREIIGDLARAQTPGMPTKEKISLRFVGIEENDELRPLPDDPASPIILLGDSHNLVFHAGGSDMHAAGAGLADQLALELRTPLDVVAVRGSGATPARINLLRKSRRAGYLAEKKLIIWCFSAREFTESDGWNLIPIVK